MALQVMFILQDSIMNEYLKNRNIDTALTAIMTLKNVSIIHICTFLMSKTLHKSGIVDLSNLGGVI